MILKDDYVDSVMVSHIKEYRNRLVLKGMLKASHIEVSYATAFPIPTEEYLIPISKAKILREGTDTTNNLISILK